MLPIRASDIIVSVVEITAHRNRETLEACLVTTLADLTGARRVSILGAETGGRVTVVASAGDAWEHVDGARTLAPDHPYLRHLPMTGAIEFHVESGECGPHALIHYYRTENQASQGWIVVESDQPLSALHAVVDGMVRIYQNYLSVIASTENDTLTGLRNRKTFDERIGRVLELTRERDAERGENDRRSHAREGRSFWLGILDIDHFKRVNDTFGHVFGDEVLLLFAQLMRRTFRADDFLFRYGGEEFVVLLSPSTPEGAALVFQRFRHAVESFEFPQVGQVTVSVGYVRIDAQLFPAEVVGHADSALYHAKRNGRNQVCRYEDLIAEGSLIESHSEGTIELF